MATDFVAVVGRVVAAAVAAARRASGSVVAAAAVLSVVIAASRRRAIGDAEGPPLAILEADCADIWFHILIDWEGSGVG